MPHVPQKTQFTFRIEGSHRQLIENAFTEQDARIQLARRLLEEDNQPITDDAITQLAHSGLRLVQQR